MTNRLIGIKILADMNIILFEDSDLRKPDLVSFSDRRFLHIRDVHRAAVGDQLRVGRLNGAMGTGLITKLDETSVEVEVTLNEQPPAPLPLTLYLALPRPKSVARILQTVATFGIKKIYVFNSYRVEKIYWSCQQIKEGEVKSAFMLGLEQARDTILPQIEFRRLFKPFVEDELPALIHGTHALVAHPLAEERCPFAPSPPLSLAIGPEGGFIDYEIEKLNAAGFQSVRTYDRILKVEAALSSLVGRLL